ncbi:hypothetical protein SAMN05444388_1153 [Flavobacterium johnsoniae]|jgi:hypothetical protein|uniref:Uncharacterized protein n=1 Tax=Flavobacterium johnsoniae TaxID=986 RepID=A0A1M5UVQ9_FLAJO|nr:hypothetical protein SAMN05444388_1153 [Flavobacterium johnsoniae]
MYISPKNEKRIVTIFCVFLIIFNLIELYFIYEMSKFDEMIGYPSINEIKTRNIRPLAFLFFTDNLANLLFVSVSLMWILMSDSSVKTHDTK